jgi:uncharacterized membrane protein
MVGFSLGVYNAMKFVHVLAAIVWVGSGLFTLIQATRLLRMNDTVKLAAFAKDVEFWGLRLFTPASLIVLIAGVAMVLYHPGLGFSDAWILLGLIGYGLTFLTGAFYLGPTSGKLARMVDTRPPDDPEIGRGIRRIFAISRVDQTVILLVVADMVFKPGT